ncbi:hypothetical protein IW261DRAFT_419060 [Armillaria novae-zelandiae]|uniref:C2H2-type domain-containing protein n=1 Tax=Armillaria novae-zelandiae TaxID=153914 RepID=A0AA39P2G7_9AGAR|nr:hypothetical protein IW261DRAFT_419060 [Armillaria novae-zelandiae]
MARFTTKPRNFICATCQKTYISKGGLLRHSKIHLTGEARDKEMFHCPQNDCNFKTLQRSNLVVHVNVVHLRLQNLVCHECEPAYHTGDPANMTRHKIRKHGQSSTDKKWLKTKEKIRPIDLMSPSPSSPTPPPFSPPASPSPSVETAPELRHNDLATSSSSLLKYYVPPKPFLCPPLPPILDRLNTSVRRPDESCSSSVSLPSLASLVLPRPRLESSPAPPFIPFQLHLNILDSAVDHNHFRHGSEPCIPARPQSPAIRTTKDDRRRSEPCLGALPPRHPSHSPSPERPAPRSLPTLPGTRARSSSSSCESSTAPSFPSPLFQPGSPGI